MSDINVILADSIASLPHLAAFDLMVKKRFTELEIDRLLIYIIDTVDESALPYLAEQFDVLGFKGYGLAKNDLERREVIKRAIELHRYKGTLWAVKEALKNIGYGDAVFTEHVDGHWAKFRVTVDLGNNPVSVTQIADLVRMINEYKNVRSHLADISYELKFEDEIILEDESYENPGFDDSDNVSVGGNFMYNGVYQYDGEKNYSQDTDILEIEIV
jgi:phage tail P2-like protein